jgi:hypothetical protein
MVDASAVKTKLDSIFSRDDLKRNIVISHYGTSLTTNDMGEEIPGFSSQETYDGIILNYQSFRNKYDKSGTYEGSSFIVWLSADVPVQKFDIVEMFTDEYKVVGIDKMPLGDQLVATRIFVKEKLD